MHSEALDRLYVRRSSYVGRDTISSVRPGRSKQRAPRVLAEYVAYMNARTHLSLGKDASVSRSVTPPSAGPIVETPQVNGLHHRYDRLAA